MKNSAYLLPATDDSAEDLAWLRSTIIDGGGEAWVFRCEPFAGASDDSIRQAFRDMRRADWEDLAIAVRSARSADEWRKLRKRFEEVARIDYFDSPARGEVEALMDALDRMLHSTGSSAELPEQLTNRVWVTRVGPKVDRMASAWLIRRFIDPDAQFRFVDPKQYKHAAGEVRFDMFEGEFTHRGELCTFEVLLDKVPACDDGLRRIGEIVHDLDLKEQTYGRPETAGVAAMINGIVAAYADDQRRLEEGARLFDALYESLKHAGDNK